MAEMDFPVDPVLGQKFTNSIGVVYEWNGVAWVVGFFDSETERFGSIGGLIDQVRVLLQDVSLAGGEYRYSNASLVMALNMGMLEMYRIRPDIFLSNNFVVPQYNSADLGTELTIEQQFVPPLIYYVTGMAQLRDNEGDQDERASGFLSKFTSMLVAVA